MKKVLAIAPYPYLPYFSGGQKFIAEFLHYLGKETDLTVISVPGNDVSREGNYKTIPLLKSSFSRYYDLSLVNKITALVKKEGFDTIIWEHPYYSWLAFRIRKRTGIRTFIHTHNIEYQRFRSTGRWWWPFLKWYEKRAFRKADGIFFITPEDKNFAMKEWDIPSGKCFDLPFGTEISQTPADRAGSREMVCREQHIATHEKIFLFTGLLSYKPNRDALEAILERINPVLRSTAGFRYKIIICGKGLPAVMNELKEFTRDNIIYAGFVRGIDSYYKAADVFLNPVQGGGGIKTKMVEALAYGTTVVSSESGAAGMDRQACNGKLKVIKDDNWQGFAEAVLKTANEPQQPTPGAFYQKYNWENIIRNVVNTTGSFYR